MTSHSIRALFVTLALAGALGAVQAKETDQESKHDSDDVGSPRILKDESQTTSGFITIKGAKRVYQAEAGVQVVFLKDPKDEDPVSHRDDKDDQQPIPHHAGMSYVAYFKADHEDPGRPITFLFNGGPGSSTVWLHMGAFGPKRVITANDSHSPAAPYRVTDNEYSLLDACVHPAEREISGPERRHLSVADSQL